MVRRFALSVAFWVVLTCLTFSVVASAQTASPEPLGSVVAGIEAKNWPLAIAGAVLIVVFLLRKVGSAFPGAAGVFFASKVGGWILNVAASAGGMFAAASAAGVPITVSFVVQILTTALAAAGGVEVFGDLLKRDSSAPPPNVVTIPGGTAAGRNPGPTLNG